MIKILYSDVLMAVHIDNTICNTSSCETVMPLSQENAADHHNLGKKPLTLATAVGVKHTDPVKNKRLHHCRV